MERSSVEFSDVSIFSGDESRSKSRRNPFFQRWRDTIVLASRQFLSINIHFICVFCFFRATHRKNSTANKKRWWRRIDYEKHVVSYILDHVRVSLIFADVSTENGMQGEMASVWLWWIFMDVVIIGNNVTFADDYKKFFFRPRLLHRGLAKCGQNPHQVVSPSPSFF